MEKKFIAAILVMAIAAMTLSGSFAQEGTPPDGGERIPWPFATTCERESGETVWELNTPQEKSDPIFEETGTAWVIGYAVSEVHNEDVCVLFAIEPGMRPLFFYDVYEGQAETFCGSTAQVVRQFDEYSWLRDRDCSYHEGILPNDMNFLSLGMSLEYK